MNNLQQNVDVLIGYMIGSEEPDIPKLTQWCKQFGDNVKKSKAVMALANGRQVPEKDMRTFGEALSVKAGKFRTSEKQTLDQRSQALKNMVSSALKFHAYLI